jgi:hypothetical protein
MPSAVAARVIGIFLDIGRGPDGVEGAVEAEPRIDVAREIAGRGDDRLQRRADEGVAMAWLPVSARA